MQPLSNPSPYLKERKIIYLQNTKRRPEKMLKYVRNMLEKMLKYLRKIIFTAYEEYVQNHSRVRNRSMNHQLQADLVEEIWSRFGEDENDE
jgi:Na+/phosphate symporter